MTKEYFHKIGNSTDNHSVMVTTWDGKHPVKVITPKEPTNEEFWKTVDFIVGELDDHDGLTKYIKLIGIDTNTFDETRIDRNDFDLEKWR